MVYRLDITARLHRRMLEIVGTALPLITKAQADADVIGVAYLRSEMMEALNAYHTHVNQLGDRELIARCNEVRGAYDAFRARWVHRDGMANWHEYRLSSVVMMKRVRSLVQEAEAIRSDFAVIITQAS